MEREELITNTQVLEWVYVKWLELGVNVKGKEYAHKRKAYEIIMWELKELMSEEDFNEIANKYVKY